MTPASFGQQRLWFLDKLHPGSALYNVPTVLRIGGALNTDRLRAAFTEVVRRHDALRTVFAERDGHPVQVVNNPTIPLLNNSIVEQRDCRTIEDAEAEIQAEARRPFDLAEGPLLRVLLLRLADDDHFLMVTLHHIVSDGWSLAILLDEVGTLYGGGALEPLPLQYPEFAAWQREEAAGPMGAMALDYWIEQLRDAPPLLTMPTDRPRPDTQTYAGRVHSFDLPRELAVRLRAATHGLGGTLFMVLLAAYQALLARYSGQDDIVVGTAVGGRSRVDAEPMIGLFVNTVPLRTSVAGDPTFRELVGRVRDVTLDGVGYADVPLERIVEAVHPDRSLGYSPVFQVQLTLQSTPPPVLDLPGLTVSEPRFVMADIAKFDLTLAAAEHGDDLHVDLEYDTALFDAATAERLADHFVRLLSTVVDDPDVRIGDVDLLTPDERHRAVVSWNDTALPLPDAATALDLIAAQVAARPDAVAVADNKSSLSYRELDQRSNQVAHGLRSAGVGPEVAVALCVERSADLVVALLAVWKAGGAYVPLDPSWPVDRLRYMLADTGAAVALVDDVTASSAFLDGVALVRVDATGPVTAPDVRLGGDSLAYVIHTSGSTGRPKGIAVPHAAVVNLLVAYDAMLALSPDDVWAAVTTLSFDISVLELFYPLTRGATVSVFDAAEATDPMLLRSRLVATGATVLQSTPSRWRLLLTAGPVPASVRTRLCGGEELTSDLAGELTGKGVTLWNNYGPTETTVWSTAGMVGGGPIALGPPIANTQVYVLDSAMRPVPVGVVGEIHLGGLGVARGYPGRADLTAERFVPDPFGTGGRLYATGDLARYRADGTLEFLGRDDHQIKIRGFRIELGEIEAALRSHPAVTEAAARVWTGAETRLAAYVESASADLRPHLVELLPEYMIPAVVVVLDALPLTPNGKIDRSRLPEPAWDNQGAAEQVAPRDAVERALAALWQELLDVPRVGVHDDFFAMGGHSLLVARMLARVREHLLVDVPMRTAFDARTIATFAAALRAAESSPGALSDVAELREEIAALPDDEVAALLGTEGTA
ncbi:Siderophore biosynthesis non-ribosomal peptide synthetase modules [Alloactinosynnema sp. L-07]|uniref:non-ribosomal peptide synthetase n=1 Tax=Alloactinosynnema sp. L-07 TaxID=1653480 RepID=UPI00065EFBE3|nr:non-ribosomal peptide synthetase [Alloactinosynnema sp. L-07]CRK62220.1 Siderophore biosynthesis non-ribosomal peptide synthetase modules [Alloactinosynnema sp. L-07]